MDRGRDRRETEGEIDLEVELFYSFALRVGVGGVEATERCSALCASGCWVAVTSILAGSTERWYLGSMDTLSSRAGSELGPDLTDEQAGTSGEPKSP